MKTEKHEAKKKDIIESAFRIWGGCRYRETSLSHLAAELSITKQALYRYFASKEKLESAMEDIALDNYDRSARHLQDELSEMTDDEWTEAYVEGTVSFFQNHSRYMGFLTYRYRHSSQGPQITRNHNKRFGEMAQERAGIPEVGFRFLNALIFKDLHFRNTVGKNLGFWKTAWYQGFGTDNKIEEPDYTLVLDDASNVDYSAFAADSMVKAVFETVMEEAGGGVSLSKVAKKAGLTKSSLYNYWPSKEEMLSDVLLRQLSIYEKLFEQFAESYDTPGNRLFAYLAFMGTFLRRNPDVLNYLQRIMNVGVNMPTDRWKLEDLYTKPLESGVSAGLLSLGEYKPVDFLGLVTLATVNEVKHHLVEDSDRSQIDMSLKDLYRLIVGGISVLRRTQS
ncbi:MAG: TetR/AcrR family transcriptional regulator [Spirochaetaceae bacterium]|nr:TetR/AcrR family transcriptional regulator [Spirochaetaceae bacterium]